jgi:hypothetical protein
LPLTERFLGEVANATAPWLWDLYSRRPRLLTTRSYWSVSPAAREAETTAGGIPVGLPDDTAYFGPLARWALRHLLAVPPSLSRLRDLEAWRRATVLALLEADDLGLISVWSPSFLTLLMRYIESADWASALSPARRRLLERVGVSEKLWPKLRLISCWADGHAKSLMPELMKYFPSIEIQPKGLLATEGVVTFPLLGHEGGVAAVTSHVLELVDLDSNRALPIHEARVGGDYTPLLTTSAGLYRYHLARSAERPRRREARRGAGRSGPRARLGTQRRRQ